jgi:hypothetical protein
MVTAKSLVASFILVGVIMLGGQWYFSASAQESMTSERVKIFADTNYAYQAAEKVEKDANSWLAKHNVRIIERKMEVVPLVPYMTYIYLQDQANNAGKVMIIVSIHYNER